MAILASNVPIVTIYSFRISPADFEEKSEINK